MNPASFIFSGSYWFLPSNITGFFISVFHLVEIGLPEMVPFRQEQQRVHPFQRVVIVLHILYAFIADYATRVFNRDGIIGLEGSAPVPAAR